MFFRKGNLLLCMSREGTRRIERTLMAEPHIRGHRISVRQVFHLVEERDDDPESVADRYGLDVADVYHALAYFHDNPTEMRDVLHEREDAMAEFRESITRPDFVESDNA